MFKSLILHPSSIIATYLDVTILTIIALPLLSALTIALCYKVINIRWIVTVSGLLQTLLSSFILIPTHQGNISHASLEWFQIYKGTGFKIGIYVDFLTACMLLMITLISWLICLYSIYYMQHDRSKRRYFTLLNLFISAISWVVIADNLWGILIGWELVGTFSCLLIGFWHQSNFTVKASTQAWLMSKLGSICFLIGIAVIVINLDDCRLLTIAQFVLPSKVDLPYWMHIAGICLIIAAFTKSAQFPFFSWLPNAMVAPTPISALLHAATILSLGFYLLVRVQPILTQELNHILIIVGYLTAFIGASAALAQQDIKRILAYSTLSQFGYMITTIGSHNITAGITYLFIHAAAKACLFLCAGIVQHQLTTSKTILNDTKKVYPPSWLRISYILAAISLIGLPGLTSFIAKETLLEQTVLWSLTYAQSSYYITYLIPLLGFASIPLTILYLGRSFKILFSNLSKEVKTPKEHTSIGNYTWLPTASIIILVGCIIILSLPSKIIQSLKIFDLPFIPSTSTYVLKNLILGISITLLILSIIFLKYMFKQNKPRSSHTPFINFFLQGWHIDNITNLVAKQVLICSKFIFKIETHVIDKAVTLLSILYVIIAHILAWIDDQLIAGVARGISIICRKLSRLYLHFENYGIQRHIGWSYFGILLILLGWIVWNNILHVSM